MADIFVSYARKDKAHVAPLVAALESQGWSVWWDPAIDPGQQFDQLIAGELERARASVERRLLESRDTSTGRGSRAPQPTAATPGWRATRAIRNRPRRQPEYRPGPIVEALRLLKRQAQIRDVETRGGLPRAVTRDSKTHTADPR